MRLSLGRVSLGTSAVLGCTKNKAHTVFGCTKNVEGLVSFIMCVTSREKCGRKELIEHWRTGVQNSKMIFSTNLTHGLHMEQDIYGAGKQSSYHLLWTFGETYQIYVSCTSKDVKMWVVPRQTLNTVQIEFLFC